MNNEILKKLINESNESEIVEFKTSLNDVNQICKYISALGNSAIVASCPCAYLIWGVEDLTKKVIGTKFDPYTSKARIDPKNTRKKVNSNVPFITYVEQYIDPKIDLECFFTKIQNKRLVCLVINVSRVLQPIMYKKEEYIRSGTSVKKLVDFPEKARRLWNSFNSSKFELEFAKTNLSFDQVKQLLDLNFYRNHINQKLDSDEELIINLKQNKIIVSVGDGNTYNITNLGAYTFAKNLSDFPILMDRTPRITKYDGNKK